MGEHHDYVEFVKNNLDLISAESTARVLVKKIVVEENWDEPISNEQKLEEPISKVARIQSKY